MYVHVNSHPIIEACSQMRFAPYIAQYGSLDDDVKATALGNSRNWSNVVSANVSGVFSCGSVSVLLAGGFPVAQEHTVSQLGDNGCG